MSMLREYVTKPLTRSSGWSRARSKHLDKQPYCAVCGRLTHLEVHHKVPVSRAPELELDPENLITLCDGSTRCHFVFGHLGNWKRCNQLVERDADYMTERFADV